MFNRREEEDKTLDHIGWLYRHKPSDASRIAVLHGYVINIKKQARHKMAMAVILVGGACLMLGLYIGLQIQR